MINDTQRVRHGVENGRGGRYGSCEIESNIDNRRVFVDPGFKKSTKDVGGPVTIRKGRKLRIINAKFTTRLLSPALASVYYVHCRNGCSAN